jgi:hypothetical protein
MGSLRAHTWVSLFAVGSLCLAQEPGTQKRDAQSTVEPRSSPGSGQKFLARFVGDWDVAKSFYPRTGEPARSKGECRQIMIHGGRFLKSEFTFEREGRKETGTGIIGFDNGKFTSVWIDSRRTAMSMRQSHEPFNGKEIVLYSASLGDGGSDSRRSRTVTHLEDDGRKILHRQYNPSPDGKERLLMELVMTRKNAATVNTE